MVAVEIILDDLSSDLTSGVINNLANAGSGISASSLGAAANMNIIDNRPPPPPHTNLLHMAGNKSTQIKSNQIELKT